MQSNYEKITSTKSKVNYNGLPSDKQKQKKQEKQLAEKRKAKRNYE